MGKKKEFKITKKWLVAQHACNADLKWLLKYFPKKKCTIPEFLKIVEEKAEHVKIVTYLWWLIHKIPKNPEPLVLEEYSGGNLFYNGDVHIKKGFEYSGNIICKNLRVDGQIDISSSSQLCADVILAKNLNIDVFAKVRVETVNVQNLNISGSATLWVDTIRAERLMINEDAEIKPRFPSSN